MSALFLDACNLPTPPRSPTRDCKPGSPSSYKEQELLDAAHSYVAELKQCLPSEGSSTTFTSRGRTAERLSGERWSSMSSERSNASDIMAHRPRRPNLSPLSLTHLNYDDLRQDEVGTPVGNGMGNMYFQEDFVKDKDFPLPTSPTWGRVRTPEPLSPSIMRVRTPSPETRYVSDATPTNMTAGCYQPHMVVFFHPRVSITGSDQERSPTNSTSTPTTPPAPQHQPALSPFMPLANEAVPPPPVPTKQQQQQQVSKKASKKAAKKEKETPAEIAVTMSRGSVGHPHRCGEACKYVRKSRGCKDGALCDHCHICEWNRYAVRGPPRGRRGNK